MSNYGEQPPGLARHDLDSVFAAVLLELEKERMRLGMARFKVA